MPTRSLRPCPTPGCPELTTRGRCPACARQADKQRGNAARRGYGATWQRIRAAYLKTHPHCETPGCTHRPTDVHHIDGSGPRGNNNDSNLKALCHACHSRTTARENAFGGKGR